MDTTMHRTGQPTPPTKSYIAHNIERAETEKPCYQKCEGKNSVQKKKKKSEGQLADEQVLETQYSDCTVITDNTIELYTFDLLRD